MTGRSGLPATPTGLLSHDTVTEDLGVPAIPPEAEYEADEPVEVQAPPEVYAPQRQAEQYTQMSHASQAEPTEWVEAQGWIVNEQGQTELVAQAPQVTPQAPNGPAPACHGS